MKKIFILLFVLLFSSTHASDSKITALVDGWVFYFPKTHNELIAVESSNPIFNSLKRLHPPEVELVLAYMLPSDLKKISLDQEPTMSQFIQITTIPEKKNNEKYYILGS